MPPRRERRLPLRRLADTRITPMTRKNNPVKTGARRSLLMRKGYARFGTAYSDHVRRQRVDGYRRACAAAAELDLPDAVFKTCPWQPRALVETGLRQWLRCCAPALRHNQVIGMPSRAVDEAWHGLILCTARYSAFCQKAYGQFLHHYPEGSVTVGTPGAGDPADEQLRRTVIAWSLVAQPGERCALWDLDERVGVDRPWGIDGTRVAEIQAAVASLGQLA
jgi:hypothetical protein